MDMKIDGKSVVPVGWVFTGFGVIISITIIGAFWVAAVDFRLQRIEEKLGIPAYHEINISAPREVFNFEMNSEKNYADSNGLSESVQHVRAN